MSQATLPRTSPLAAGTAIRSPVASTRTVRVITINTHRGQGPKLPYLLETTPAAQARRIRLLHETRAYTYHIADWIHRHGDAYDVVALQEVWRGSFLSVGQFLRRAPAQRDFYTDLSGYPTAIPHLVGFSGFRFENLLLSRLPPAPESRIRRQLPCRVFRLAACGFTLAPFELDGRVVWIGNTHLHAYNPRARARQAASIARVIRHLGDVPVLFLGDVNTVPPGCKDGDFPHGDRDVKSYKNDRTIKMLQRAGLNLVDHADDARFWTYPTGLPNRTLDYILHSRHWRVADYRVVREFALSDHYPVEGEFELID